TTVAVPSTTDSPPRVWFLTITLSPFLSVLIPPYTVTPKSFLQTSLDRCRIDNLEVSDKRKRMNSMGGYVCNRKFVSVGGEAARLQGRMARSRIYLSESLALSNSSGARGSRHVVGNFRCNHLEGVLT